MDDVLDLEHQGWQAIMSGKARDFYDVVMTEDTVMVLPGMVLDRDAVLDSWDGVPAWERYDLDDVRFVRAGEDTSIITYRATAVRGGTQKYRALMSSVYVRSGDGWRLAFHQQTPLSEEF